MKTVRTIERRTGNEKKIIRPNSRTALTIAAEHAFILIDTVCLIAGSEHLIGESDHEPTARLRTAIAEHDTEFLFAHLMEIFSFQGISDAAARGYMDEHGRVTWRQVESSLSGKNVCPKLSSYWAFENCGYEKSSRTCLEPDRTASCGLTKHNLRTGRLNQTATFHAFLVSSW